MIDFLRPIGVMEVTIVPTPMLTLFKCLAFLYLFAMPLVSVGGVDEDSIFGGARNAASQLDLTLSYLQRHWWQTYVKAPSERTADEHPLITRSGTSVDLGYYGDDRISATGWITDLNGFLELSRAERKKLLKNTLSTLRSTLSGSVTLVERNTGRISGEMLKNQHIELSLIINDVLKDKAGKNIRLFLPFEIGVGQAGYKDGQFVYSEPYYLDLEVEGGVADSGNSEEFAVEGEQP